MKKIVVLLLAVMVVSAAVLIAGLGGTSAASSSLSGQSLLAGRNVNMVSGTKLPFGDPWLQRQNEPSIAASTRNPMHLLAGANDYRTIDVPDDFKLPGIEGTASADAWLGVYESFDGGESWITTLLPGFPQDASSEGQLSPLNDYETACDPIVRAGANGLFYYCGIAFNRARDKSALFVARYVDNNNLEKVEIRTDQDGTKKYFGPIQYVDTRLVATGSTSSSFIDMPNIAVDVPRMGALYGNVYVAYTVFSNTGGSSIADKIFFQRSTDGGVTWSVPPVQLSTTGEIVQRPIIAVDPIDLRGNTIYVAFRRFAKGNVPDGIVVVKSTNGGKTFSKLPDVSPSFYPFDQGTSPSPSSFRTNSYPTIAVGDLGTVYVAWSQRLGGPNGQARIMISALRKGGLVWSTPRVVDQTYAGIGHQFMPSLTFAAWKLMLAWYDQREDAALDDSPFIRDPQGGVRHTIDVRAAEGRPGLPPVFSPSIQLSRYLHVLDLDANGNPIEENGYYRVIQAEDNPINYPLFQLGTVPFHGDYLEITPSVRILPPAIAFGFWIYNINPFEPASFHAAWTDNRDVRPPNGNTWGDWVSYNAPGSIQDGWPYPQPPACSDGAKTGMRNQNVYTANINKGLVMGSPGNTKQLDLPLTGEGGRTFVVFVKNTAEYERELDLRILEIGGVDASFDQFINDDRIQVNVQPYSSVSCTVYLDRSTRRLAPVTVNAFEGLKLVGYVVLNPDPTNLPLNDPDNPFQELGKETHDPDVSAPQVWNYDLGDESDPNASAVLNPRVQNPRVQNYNVVNPRVQNEGVLNPRVQNESIVNNEVPNPRVQNTVVPNGALTDVTWTVTNEGNTTSVFTTNIRSEYPDYFNGEDPPLVAQVLVYKVHRVPVDKDCQLYETHQDELIANISNPRVQNPRVQNSPIPSSAVGSPGSPVAIQAADLEDQDISFYLAPGEQAEVTFRVWDEDTTDGLPTFSPDLVTAEAVAEAVNTEEVEAGGATPSFDLPPNPEPWVTPMPKIAAVPASFVLRAASGVAPADRTLTIQNVGAGTLRYSVEDDAAWLAVSPAPAEGLGPDEGHAHTVSFATAGLPVGQHLATIIIRDPQASNNPLLVHVAVFVYTSGLPPANEWTARFATPGDTEDIASKVAVDDAGYVYVAGSSGPAGFKDVIVVKYDPYGVKVWEIRHTGPSGLPSGNDIAVDMALDAEGSVYVVGSSENGPGGDSDFLTFKYSALGELQWTARYGYAQGLQDYGRRIILDSAGNAYVAGWSSGTGTYEDYAIVKYGPTGNQLWTRRYNGTANQPDLVEDIAMDAAGDVYVTGTSYENGTENDMTTIKFSGATGSTLWIRSVATLDSDRGVALAVGPSGSVYATGRTLTPTADYNFVTVKYDPAGELMWTRTYNGSGSGYDAPSAIAVDLAESVYVTGQSDSDTSIGQNPDYLTVMYDSAGTEIWTARYNGPGNGEDVPLDVAVNPLTGEVVVTGYSDPDPTEADRTDYATIMYDSAGSPNWVRRYNGFATGGDSAQSVAIDRTGNIYVTGLSLGDGTGFDFATVKYMPEFEEWSATENGSAGLMDYALDVAADADGNVYVTGASAETGRGTDMATIKYDADGNRLWKSLYNGTANGDDFGKDIAFDSSGNVYITGTSIQTGTDADITTIKYDRNGNLIWQKFYGSLGSLSDSGVAISLDPFGHVLVAGSLNGAGGMWGGGGENIVTLQYNSAGELLWDQVYEDPDIAFNYAVGMAVSPAGNIHVAGTCYSDSTGNDYITLKYDSGGSLQWHARYNGPAGKADWATDLAIDADENVYLTGYGQPLPTGMHPVTVKYDSNGVEQWSTISPDSARAQSIAVDSSGNVYITGTSTIKFDNGGVQQWTKGEPLFGGEDLFLDSSGNLYVSGYCYANIGSEVDCATVKYDSAGNELWMAVHHHPGDDMGRAIAIDPSDNIYVVTTAWEGETTGDIITIKYRPGRH